MMPAIVTQAKAVKALPLLALGMERTRKSTSTARAEPNHIEFTETAKLAEYPLCCYEWTRSNG